MRSRSLALLALLAVPALAACGSDDKPAPAASGGGATLKYQSKAKSQEQPAALAPAAGTIGVDLKNTQFVPAAIKAKVGQKITWTNSDAIAHTVTATENAKFDSGTMEAGAKFEYVAKQAGTISYVCDFHPGMTGTITVQ
jgi:plastocyanin